MNTAHARIRHTRRTACWLSLAASLTTALVSHEAKASACCISATAVGAGLGRLVFWEDFAVGFRLGYAENIGHWDRSRHFSKRADNWRDRTFRSQVWGIVAIVPQRLSFALSVPLLMPYRRLDDLREWGFGFGDIAASLRLDLRTKSKRAVPALALIAGVVTPTGRSPEGADSQLGARITGRGSWANSLAIQLEWAPNPWFLRIDAALAYAYPRSVELGHRPTLRIQNGPSAQMALTSGVQLVEGLVVSGYVRANYEGRVQLDRRHVPESQAYEIAGGLGASWQVQEHWSLQLSFESPLGGERAGRNREANLNTTIGVRYGFWKD